MNKKILASVFLFILFSMTMLTNPPLIWPGAMLVVFPTDHDFGDVELGTSDTTIITLLVGDGVPIEVSNIYFKAGSSVDFSIITELNFPLVIYPYEFFDLTITFSPSSSGDWLAILVIESNADNPLVEVTLRGVGIEAEPAPMTIEEILAFFDESVIEGTLEGKGRGKLALVRLFVLRKMIKRAGKLIDRGRIRAACRMLMRAYKRCDGIRRPPDFVKGEALPELASMIQQLRSTLGCN